MLSWNRSSSRIKQYLPILKLLYIPTYPLYYSGKVSKPSLYQTILKLFWKDHLSVYHHRLFAPTPTFISTFFPSTNTYFSNHYVNFIHFINYLVFFYQIFTKFISWNFKSITRSSRAVCRNYQNTIWATSWENLFMSYANNKDAEQPAHPRSLISVFVVRCLDSIIPLVSISEISSL